MPLQATMQCRSSQMWDRWLQRIKAIIQRQQRMPPERDNHCLLFLGQGRGMRGLRPGLHILDCRPLTPLGNRLRVDPKFPAQSLRSLYCCSDGVRGRGAPVTYLPDNASFHSDERTASSNHGIKHLILIAPRSLVVFARHCYPRVN